MLCQTKHTSSILPAIFMNSVLLVLIVTITNHISAWPSPPSSRGTMELCRPQICFIKKDGSSSGCQDPCRCVSLNFNHGVYDGPGNCWEERWH
uniref:Putative 8 kDa amblyomma family n=1 Tax=Rhipicephalus pulchellus TaxID=72859 RepID=L7MAH1_RHIPC